MWFHRRYDFYQMLLDQAKMSEEGLKLLCEFVKTPDEPLGRRVDEVENQADELRRALIEAINRTFVTPIDREDIFNLSRAIDDMVDYAKTTVEEMLLFKVGSNDYLVKMAQALYQASRHITLAVAGLREMNGDIQPNIIKAKKSENLMEHLYHEALVELFKDTNIINLFKMREIYRHLNNAADRGDEAADIVSDIFVKNS